MTTYLALLRGINVGGNTLISMAELRENLAADGLENVRTYINSGNVIFESKIKDTDKLAKLVNSSIQKRHQLKVDVVVFSKAEWQAIIKAAPSWWGKDKTWKHNLISLIKPYDMEDIMEVFSKLKPEIESIKAGEGIIYQSTSFVRYGQTSSSRIVGTTSYKRMTIRNYNTATKLAVLLG